MKIGPLKPLMLSALLFTAPVVAQVMPDIGFKSVGRGWPLADPRLLGPSPRPLPGRSQAVGTRASGGWTLRRAISPR